MSMKSFIFDDELLSNSSEYVAHITNYKLTRELDSLVTAYECRFGKDAIVTPEEVGRIFADINTNVHINLN